MKRLLLSVVMLLLIALPAKAQPMVDLVPEDAAIYVGSTGWSELEQAYGKSHLKFMLEPNGQSWSVDQMVRYFIEAVKLENEADAKEMEAMYKMMAPSLKILKNSPVAFYVVPNLENPEKTQVAILVKAGKDADNFKDQVEGFIALSGDEQVEEEVKILSKDGIVRLAVNAPEAMKPAKSIKDKPSFKEISSTQGQPGAGAFYMYADIKKLDESMNQAAEMAPMPEAKMAVPMAQKLLSTDSFKSFYLVCGFDGPDWKSYAMLEADGELKGLPKTIFGKSIAPDTLQIIPASSMMAGVIRVDLNDIIALLIEEAKAMEEGVEDQIAEMDKMIIDQVGFDVRKDLLGNFGADWGFFMDPATTGDSPLGVVFFNKSRDAKTLESSLLKLAAYMVKKIKESEGPDMEDLKKLQLAPRTHTVSGVKMHTAAFPIVAPSFTFVGDKLVVALYPQTLAAAVKTMGKSPSILTQPDVKAMLASMKGKPLTAMTFADPRQNVNRSYPLVLSGLQMVTGFVNVIAEESPVVYMPTLPEVRANLKPMTTMIWTDAKGVSIVSDQAFPGSGIFMAQENSIAIAPLGAGILLPALNQVRTQAAEQNSKANLRGIYQGSMGYAGENGDQLPKNGGVLVTEDHLPARIFLNPRYGEGKAPVFDLSTKEGQQKAINWVEANSEYKIYWERFSLAMGPNEIVGHEFLEDFDEVAVLFGDGHAEVLPVNEVYELLEASEKAHEKRMKNKKK